MNIYRIKNNENTLLISYAAKEKLYRIYFNDNKIDEVYKNDLKNNVEYILDNNKITISLNNRFSNKPFIVFNEKMYSGEQEAMNRHRANLSIFALWLLLEIIGAVWNYTKSSAISFYLLFIFITCILGILVSLYLFKHVNYKIYSFIPLIFLIQIIANIIVNEALTLSDLIFISIFLYSLWEFSFVKKVNKFVIKKS
jgi:heme/copper-type cytochrome/quinol oxidase subunit 4